MERDGIRLGSSNLKENALRVKTPLRNYVNEDQVIENMNGDHNRIRDLIY